MQTTTIVTIINFCWFPIQWPTIQANWCPNTVHNGAINEIYATPSARQSMSYLKHFTECLLCQSSQAIDRILKNLHACCMHAIAIAKSRICDWGQHFCAPECAVGAVRFFNTKRNSHCIAGSIGEHVCKTAHAFVPFSQNHSPNSNLDSTILVTKNLH